MDGLAAENFQGLLAVAHATRSNLARHPRPGPDRVLEDGELPGLVRGLDVLRYEEGWLESGRHEARLVARRPARERSAAWALVVAGKGGKRSRAAREIAGALASRGLRVGGFTQRTIEPEVGPKTIELVRVRDGRALPLARSAPDAGAEPASCAFVFDRAALEEAGRWVDADAREADVLVVDGLGKLELGGGGNRAAIARALAGPRLVVLAIRDDQLVYAMEALGLGEPVASCAEADGAAALDRFVDEVARAAGVRG